MTKELEKMSYLECKFEKLLVENGDAELILAYTDLKEVLGTVFDLLYKKMESIDKIKTDKK